VDEFAKLKGNVVELTDGPVVLQGMPTGVAILQKGDRLKLVDVRRSPDRKSFVVDVEVKGKPHYTMMDFPTVLFRGIS